MKVYPSIERLHELFLLDPNQGLIARRSLYQKTGIFESCGSVSKIGVRVSILNKEDNVSNLFMRGKIVWAMYYGSWPESTVFRKNGINSDDRVSNLTLDRKGRNIDRDFFIEKAQKKFGERFDYSIMEYIDRMTRIELVCPSHGIFTTTPHSHLSTKGNGGCLACKTDSLKRFHSLSTEEFLNKCKKKFGDLSLNMDNYINYGTGSIEFTCEKHGLLIFDPPWYIISTKSGCRLCDNSNPFPTPLEKYDHYIEQAKSFYENFYEYPDYNLETFQNKKSKISVICPEHGVFQCRLIDHLVYAGCKICNPRLGSYCFETFENDSDLAASPGTLYYISVNGGEFFKIGITRQTLNKRMISMSQNARAIGRDIGKTEVIMTLNSTLYDCFVKEQIILKENRDVRVFNLGWTTEVFREDITNNILKFFTKVSLL